MNCPVCDRFAPADPETGYDCDGVCPGCEDDGWIMDVNGDVRRMRDNGRDSEDDSEEPFVIAAEGEDRD